MGARLGLRGRGPRDSGAGRARSLAQFEAGFDEALTQDRKDRAYFGIEVDGELIGEAGLTGSTTSAAHARLGIGIGRDFWGKGFGQDAVRTLVDYAFEHLIMNRVGLYVLAEDPRAVGAYRKAGFVEEGRSGSRPGCEAGTRTSS